MIKLAAACLGICCAVGPAHAQMSAPSIRSALPNVSSITLNNAAGALHYCVSKGLVSSTSAESIRDRLAKKRVQHQSADFRAGATGEILAEKHFLIGSAPRFLQSQACDLVLKRTKDFL